MKRERENTFLVCPKAANQNLNRTSSTGLVNSGIRRG